MNAARTGRPAPLPRSLLFIPVLQESWVAKAGRFRPDGVILDLEDSVPPAEKPRCRALVRGQIGQLAAAGIRPLVRINGLDDGGFDDLEHVVAPALFALVVPKSGTRAQILDLCDRLSWHEGRAGLPRGATRLVLLLETAAGIRDGHDLLRLSPRCLGLFGALSGPIVGDIARAVNILPSIEGDEQAFYASRLVLDTRAAGRELAVAAITGTALDDLALVRRLAERARRFGMTTLALIHPSHVAVANAVFTPSAEELAEAVGLIQAMAEGERRGLGAVRYRDRMVDYAMLPQAQSVLDEALRRDPGLAAALPAEPAFAPWRSSLTQS
jgi:citrate lyase subunit beta/citryl-CoA lyase